MKLSLLHILVGCVLTSIYKVQLVGKLDDMPHCVKVNAKPMYCCIGSLCKQSSSSMTTMQMKSMKWLLCCGISKHHVKANILGK